MFVMIRLQRLPLSLEERQLLSQLAEEMTWRASLTFDERLLSQLCTFLRVMSVIFLISVMSISRLLNLEHHGLL